MQTQKLVFLFKVLLTSSERKASGYEARPGRTPRETLEEDIMVILDEGKQASW